LHGDLGHGLEGSAKLLRAFLAYGLHEVGVAGTAANEPSVDGPRVNSQVACNGLDRAAPRWEISFYEANHMLAEIG